MKRSGLPMDSSNNMSAVIMQVLARLNKVRLTVDASTSAAMRESMVSDTVIQPFCLFPTRAPQF